MAARGDQYFLSRGFTFVGRREAIFVEHRSGNDHAGRQFFQPSIDGNHALIGRWASTPRQDRGLNDRTYNIAALGIDGSR